MTYEVRLFLHTLISLQVILTLNNYQPELIFLIWR